MDTGRCAHQSHRDFGHRICRFLIAIPLILVRLPADYFDTRTPRHSMKDHHPVLRPIGADRQERRRPCVPFLAGFAMLFLPGQGLLTMLIGISLIDFPKKRHLEAKMVGQPTLLMSLTTCAVSLINHH